MERLKENPLNVRPGFNSGAMPKDQRSVEKLRKLDKTRPNTSLFCPSAICFFWQSFSATLMCRDTRKFHNFNLFIEEVEIVGQWKDIH